ncbi:MAG: Rne/Rng family ribonuclease [Nitrospirota bacterium]|jgi:ribonuclease G
MSTLLVVNAATEETRVALVENRVVTEIYIDRTRARGTIGNIYKGRVSKVLPGMEAAFVDIGLHKAAFLHVDDIRDDSSKPPPRAFHTVNGDVDEANDDAVDEEESDTVAELERRPTRAITELIKEGQEVLVQVVKEPMGTKGPRVTTYLTFPGRYLVYMPDIDHVGVSRKIEDEAERERLRGLVEETRQSDEGYVVRTVSEGCTGQEFAREAQFLRKLWANIAARGQTGAAPALLHSDLDLVTRTVRDLLNDDVDRLIIDSPTEYDRLLQFVNAYLPELAPRIQLYQEEELIFDHFGVEMDLSRALRRRVWLRSGGYIVIDQTEALTAIDVNTGRFVGQRNLEDTILKTNLEAVDEIAYQLRLRNIGGIIIIDFIDMEVLEHREKVYEQLVAATATDKARTTIYPVSELGLVEMTRKRVRENLGRTMMEPCPQCDGTGYVKSGTSIAYDLFREVRRVARRGTGCDLVITAHPDIVDLLYGEERLTLDELELAFQCRIQVEASHDPFPDHFKVERIR